MLFSAIIVTPSLKIITAASEDYIENTWETLVSMPGAGLYKAAVVDSKIYVFGSSVNYEYDPATDTWTVKTPMPTERTSFAVTVCEAKVYIIGGKSIGEPADGLNYVYDPVTDTWATKESMLTPRYQMDANTVDGKIYVVGGRTGEADSTVNVTEVFDPLTDSWITKASIPYPVASYASAVVGNKIYVIGGQAEFHDPMNPGFVQIYDTAIDAWTQGTPHPQPAWLAEAAAATAGVYAPKKIYVMGGEGGFANPLDQNYAYDPQTDTWSVGALLPTALIRPAVAVVDDLVYVMGGGVGWLTTTATVERYTPFLYGDVPAVSVLSPCNQTYFSGDVQLAFTVSEPVVSLSYSLDGEDVTATGNTALTSLSTGLHTLRVYAWDAAGNVGASETVMFIVEPFSTILIAAAVATLAIISIGLLVYFKKRKG